MVSASRAEIGHEPLWPSGFVFSGGRGQGNVTKTAMQRPYIAPRGVHAPPAQRALPHFAPNREARTSRPMFVPV